MKSGVTFENIWHDDDMFEFRISSSDGRSLFVQEVYVGYGTVDETIEQLDVFKNHIYGGIYDVAFGSFGPEYASGAFLMRLHFQERGKINVTISAQAEYEEFGKNNIASEIKLYVVSEPALLDNYISSLKALNNRQTDSAFFECI